MTNRLYYGDNLSVLRGHIADSSVDLIYLDPPFNSNATYNLLFQGEKGRPAAAQIQAFSDTWHWDDAAENAYAEIMTAGGKAANAADALRKFLGESAMMAYLAMMGIRLLELRRALKNTGSIYLHCDPTASHYIKIMMDQIFGAENFRNEIIWRIGWVSGYKTQKRGWIRNHDTILYYTKSREFVFNKEYIPYPPGYTRRNGTPPEGKGVPIEDTWNCNAADRLDSIMIKSFSTEKVGYPTQKPLALLERIISASSKKGDLVFDPFCGCGTTIHAAEKLKRRWIGVDITHLAVGVIEKRLEEYYGNSAEYQTVGMPASFEDAVKLADANKFEFEAWAVSRIPRIMPNQKQVGDRGVDGVGYFKLGAKTYAQALVQVKAGKYVGPDAVRSLRGALARDRADFGILAVLKDDNITPGMKKEALRAGRFKGKAGLFDFDIPKIQIWSMERFFAGHLPELPYKV